MTTASPQVRPGPRPGTPPGARPGSPPRPRPGSRENRLPLFFLGAFVASCFWFWWLISLIYRFVLGVEDPVGNATLGLSIASVALFAGGFLLTRRRIRPSSFSAQTLDSCERLCWKLTVLLFFPATTFALIFLSASVGKLYGHAGTISPAEQVVFYAHLFAGCMFLGLIRDSAQAQRRIWTAALLLTLPRLLISLEYGRVFVAQAAVPIILIAVARGFVQLSFKRILQIALLGLFILVVPSITRGDPVFSTSAAAEEAADMPQIVNWVAAGSSLQVSQDYQDLDLSNSCPPLLVSLTGKLVPYALLHVCTVRLFGVEIAANLDRLVTHAMFGDGDPEDIAGTGTSYLLELYLTGGIFGVLCGSFLFGAACRLLTASLAARSLFAGIWAECLMRALFAPRGMLGYVFEKVPGLMLAAVTLACLCYLLRSRGTRAAAALTAT